MSNEEVTNEKMSTALTIIAGLRVSANGGAQAETQRKQKGTLEDHLYKLIVIITYAMHY